MPNCRGCNKEIVWAKSPAGKNTPYEKVSAVEIEFDHNSEDTFNLNKLPDRKAIKVERDIYISHFLTCKNANQFSGSRP